LILQEAYISFIGLCIEYCVQFGPEPVIIYEGFIKQHIVNL